MIRMLHAADLHLDSPFAALAPEQAAQRREEQRQLLRRLAEECELRGCQLLLLAGDLFDSETVYRETAELLCRTLGSIRAKVFIAPGNHDPWSPRSPYANLNWPDNVHIFHSRVPELVRLEEPAVNVYGAAFTDSRDTGLLDDFSAPKNDAPSIMVVHGVYGDPSSPYGPITEQEVLFSGLQYLALGHVHKQELRSVGETTIGNPGCAMGRGFDETGPKGAFFVELEEDDCRVTPVELGGRVYETLTVRVEGDPLASIRAALPEDTARDIYRLTLVGNCPTPDLDAIRAALRTDFFALELVDKTLPPLVLWRDAEEDSLRGEFLRRLKLCYDAEEEEDSRRLVALAAQLGLAMMEKREVPEL